jgi:bifunctional DNA-binding transcriptional regulator/antitoxin component of YhaV-PrlF toxin-antitoxin module
MKIEYKAKILSDGHLSLPGNIRERLHLKLDDMVKVIVTKVVNKKPSERFLATFGSWEDERTAEEIIKDIYISRKEMGIG